MNLILAFLALVGLGLILAAAAAEWWARFCAWYAAYIEGE